MKIKVLVSKFVDYAKSAEAGKKVYAKLGSVLERDENDIKALNAVTNGWAEIVIETGKEATGKDDKKEE